MARRPTNRALARALGERLREHRRTRDLSQEALAELADVHRTYVGRVERGDVNITVDLLVSLAGALGVSPSSLLEGLDR